MNKNLLKKHYLMQSATWPVSGKHILAQYDDESIIVYQSYRPEIGEFAVRNQYFGGEFSYSRMSWIKPNFLWMMYRNGWGTKVGQEITLSIRLKLSFFEQVLESAVAANFIQASTFSSEIDWKKQLLLSSVRLQWDPDHDPSGKKLQRKAIQLGLRNEVLREFGRNAIIEICDISEFVSEQQKTLTETLDGLIMPAEKVFIPRSELARNNIGLDF